MSDLSKRLLRNGSVYTFSSAASAATALLITPILTRTLGVQQYDQVAIAIVVMNIAINFLSLGLPTAIIRAVHSEPSGRPLARTIAVMGFAVVLATAGLAAGVASFVGLGSGIAFALLAGGAGGAIAMVLAFYVATERPRPYVLVSFGISLGGPAVGVLCTITLGPQAIHYIGGLALTYVVMAVLATVLLPRQVPHPYSRNQFVRALSIGLPMVPHQLAVGAASGASVLLAALLLPEGAAAGAQLALLVASAPLAIISALTAGWTPIILSSTEEERGTRLEETSSVVAILAALGGGALSMLAPWFIQFLAPKDQFDIAAIVPTVAIASGAPVLAVAYTAHLQIVIASGRTFLLAILSPLAVGIAFVVGLFLIRWAGLPGAGLMFVTVYVMFFFFARTLARRVSSVRWSESGLMYALLIAVLISLAGALLPWGTPLFAAVRLGVAAILLVGALFAFAREMRPTAT